MKKILVALFLVAMMSTPAFALFANGGFENGTLSGWTLSGTGTSGIWDSSSTMAGLTTDINPYNGQYMARINDSGGGYHTKLLSQLDTIAATDLAVFVNWGAALVEPTNGVYHSASDQPYFSIKVYIDGLLEDSFSANAGNLSGWTQVGTNPPGWDAGIMWYKNGTYSYDLTGLTGKTIQIELYAEDCGLGGHGAFAFLDGIGSTYDPIQTPEPASMLLLGLGLFGLATLRRKM